MPSLMRSGKIRVLLCDDHAMVREGTRRILEGEPDIEVVGEAEDGFQAIRMVQELVPDVVAMDVSMPRMNGIEATKCIKEMRPETFVLALTAYDDFQYVSRLLENGASGYMLKSSRSEELIAAIRATALGDSVLDAGVARELFARLARRTPGQTHPEASRGTSGGPEAQEPAARTPLTGQELRVLQLASRGLANKEIASHLEVSPRTVQSHLSSVFLKLGVSSRTEAVVTALRTGLIDACTGTSSGGEA